MNLNLAIHEKTPVILNKSFAAINLKRTLLRMLHTYLGVIVTVALAGAGPAVVLSQTCTMFLRPGAIFQKNPSGISISNPLGNQSGGTAISVGASAMTDLGGGSGLVPQLPTCGRQQQSDPHFAPQLAGHPLTGHLLGWPQEQTVHPGGVGAAEALTLYFKVNTPGCMRPVESTVHCAFM